MTFVACTRLHRARSASGAIQRACAGWHGAYPGYELVCGKRRRRRWMAAAAADLRCEAARGRAGIARSFSPCLLRLATPLAPWRVYATGRRVQMGRRGAACGRNVEGRSGGRPGAFGTFFLFHIPFCLDFLQSVLVYHRTQLMYPSQGAASISYRGVRLTAQHASYTAALAQAQGGHWPVRLQARLGCVR